MRGCTAVVLNEPGGNDTTLPRRLPLQELAHETVQVRRGFTVIVSPSGDAMQLGRPELDFPLVMQTSQAVVLSPRIDLVSSSVKRSHIQSHQGSRAFGFFCFVYATGDWHQEGLTGPPTLPSDLAGLLDRAPSGMSPPTTVMSLMHSTASKSRRLAPEARTSLSPAALPSKEQQPEHMPTPRTNLETMFHQAGTGGARNSLLRHHPHSRVRVLHIMLTVLHWLWLSGGGDADHAALVAQEMFSSGYAEVRQPSFTLSVPHHITKACTALHR